MKKVIFILSVAIGIALILIGYNQKNEKISNFKDDNSSITIIDLSKQETDYFNYYIISGLLLISIGLIVSIDLFKKPITENKINPLDLLTIQEKKVVHFISEEKSNKEIANELSISVSTIKTHISNIYKKVGVNSRVQLLKALKN